MSDDHGKPIPEARSLSLAPLAYTNADQSGCGLNPLELLIVDASTLFW